MRGRLARTSQPPRKSPRRAQTPRPFRRRRVPRKRAGGDARAPRKRAVALYPASPTHGRRVGGPARSRAEGADCLGARAFPPARRNRRERWRTGRNDRASPGNIAARGNVRAGCPRSRAPPSAGLRLPPQHRVGRQRAGETPAHPGSAPRRAETPAVPGSAAGLLRRRPVSASGCGRGAGRAGGQSMFDSTQLVRSLFGAAPTFMATASPPLKSSRVGMPRTW